MNSKPEMSKTAEAKKEKPKKVGRLAKLRQGWIDNMGKLVGKSNRHRSTRTTKSVKALKGGSCSGK